MNEEKEILGFNLYPGGTYLRARASTVALVALTLITAEVVVPLGTWGSGIFDDDVALDVRGLFEEKIGEGASVEDATQAVLQEFDSALEHMDDDPVIHLAIAALQLEQGRLLAATRQEALRVIDEGRNLARWEEAGLESLDERKRVLSGFKASLLSAK